MHAGLAPPRAAAPADIDALWALRTRAVRAGCAAHYPPEVIETWAAAPAPASLARLVRKGSVLVLEDAGRPLAYAALDCGTGEVDAVFVDPAYGGRGLALLLVGALEAMARARGLRRLFLSASLNAVPFYRRAGYTALREEAYPHRSGLAIASVFMEKQLGGPA